MIDDEGRDAALLAHGRSRRGWTDIRIASAARHGNGVTEGLCCFPIIAKT
jgi:hypothetical protein